MLNKENKEVYLCSLIKDSDPTSYMLPRKFTQRFNYFTIVQASGFLATQVYGQNIDKMFNGIANYNIFKGVFKEGDLLYINGAKPSDEEEYVGQNANAFIKSVNEINHSIQLVIEKRVLKGF